MINGGALLEPPRYITVKYSMLPAEWNARVNAATSGPDCSLIQDYALNVISALTIEGAI